MAAHNYMYCMVRKMFKSLQWKIVIMFLLLVLSVLIIAGTVLITKVGEFYFQRFSNDMEVVFTDQQITSQLTSAASSDNSLKKISEIIVTYSDAGRLGINQNRNYYILDAKTAGYQDGSDPQTGDLLEKTPNIIAAMNGEIGNSINTQSKFMDYAYPVIANGSVRYVIYIKDNKDEVAGIIESIFLIILQAIGWGVFISLILGYFLSKNITKPIITLTKRAEKLASFEEPESYTSAKKSDDEIGILADTFSFMSKELFKTLEQIEGEKTKMETILVNLTDGVIAFDLNGKIIHINPAAKRMLSIFNPDIVEFNQLFNDIGVKINLGDIVYLGKNKTFERSINLNYQIIKAFFAAFMSDKDKETEKIGGVVVALQDITKQQKLDNSRREFVANVSHELRTPLTTVKSYTETLLDTTKEDGMEKHFLEVINSEVDRMTRIVKDLLTLSRLDHSKETLKKDEIDLRVLIDGVVEKLSFSAKERKQSLVHSFTTNIPPYIGDRDKIEQVLINIVSNAIKYTPDGGNIDVFAGKIYNEIYIKVKDNGIGIPKSDIKRIFERFYRVDKARTRKAGGTGLGLAIAKEIIEAHGGKISIQSDTGKGCEVMITLPITNKKK